MAMTLRMTTLRMTWTELCRSEDFSGLWVALDNCRYDHQTRQPVEGDVVDADPDLSELCSRMRETGRCSCAIFRCDDSAAAVSPSSSRRSSVSGLMRSTPRFPLS